MPSSALCLLWEKLPRSGIIIDFGSLVSNVHRFGDPSIRFVFTKTQDFGTHSEVIVEQIRETQGGMVTEGCETQIKQTEDQFKTVEPEFKTAEYRT